MRNEIEDFKAAMRSAGLQPPERIEPGRFYRFPGAGKPHGDDAGRCILFDDMQGGWYGDYSSGLNGVWQAERAKPFNKDEFEAFKRRCEADRKAREAEDHTRHEAAAKTAVELLKAATGDPSLHPYATRKGVPFGPRISRGAWPQRGWKDALLVPLYDAEKRIWSLEAINEDGQKDYLKGGRKTGCFHPFGKVQGASRVFIGEGLATVAAVHSVDDAFAVAAMDAGNLEHVARAIRALAPDAEIFLLADDDQKPDGSNPGLKAATDAAAAVRGRVAVPKLGRKADFWDVWKEQGTEGIRQALATAVNAPMTAGDARTRKVELINGASIRPEPINWLWAGWLAAGKFHVIAGPPGTGKTTLALAMAAIVTSGGRWPDGSFAGIGNVLVWSGEDDPCDTLAPRLRASGAAMERVFFVGSVSEMGERRPFDPATDTGALLSRAQETGNVRLLIVDPIVSAVSGDSHKNGEVRRGLQPLVDLGAALGCAVLGVSHFSKGTAGRDPVERVTGSIAFGALARVVMGAVKRSEDDGGGRLLVRAKSNIGPDSGGFEYGLNQTALEGFPGVYASCVRWGELVEGEARELLGQAEQAGDPTERSATDEAMDWLREILKGGPRNAAEVQREARQAGISDKPLRTARERLGIKPAKQSFAAGWFWSLPDHAKMPLKGEDADLNSDGNFADAGHLGGGERQHIGADTNFEWIEVTV